MKSLFSAWSRFSQRFSGRSRTRANGSPKGSLRKLQRATLALQRLEDRTVPAGVYPNDPDFIGQHYLHNTGQTGGRFDADIDAPAAWSVTTGYMATVVAVLDCGVDYTDPDLYLNIWLNQDEIPAAVRAGLADVDNDALITFRDLNAPSNASFVSDLNGNGYIDGGDLLHDPRWADGLDADGNGRTDDLIGWDFHDNDNDPQPAPDIGHGTDMAKKIGAVGNNSVGMAGVTWQVRLLPVRMQATGGLTADRNIANAAAGLDYAVVEGARISNNSWGDASFSQVMYDAIGRARLAGHLFMAAAGNTSSNNDVTPIYPAAYDLDNIISLAAVDAFDNLSGPSNYGPVSVDLAAPSPSPGNTSSATALTTGVAALLQGLHPDWSYAQIKDRILSTVEPLPSLAGKTVTGGRVNAAMALATTSLSISDPTITEGNTGTSQLAFTVTRVGDSTGSVTLNWSTADGTATAGSDYVTTSGQITFLPSGSNTQTITVSIKGDLAAEASETFFVNLHVVSGNAVLADDQAQGTILDNDTKFYVVNDGSPDRTYEYGAAGNAIENYALNSGNTAPRGAASTAAGDKVWVVDANKKVYVYNTAGGLVGSWTADTLASNAQVEGLATNGTDVWLVDAKQDKVFRYAGAASRLSGSQSATSSFNLNSADSNPKGIVTDGASFWVVDDGTSSDKVYKYTLTGTLLGSWTIAAANSHPTGLTIDPVNVSDIWIVDNGTLKVYQYTAAASRTSGSQNAAATFALAAGNTNPQDIADPPPAISIDDAEATEGSYTVEFLDRFVTNGSGGLTTPTRGTTFGPDGNHDGAPDLYVASTGSNAILRYDGVTGSFIDTFVPSGTGGLNSPTDPAFGPDGNLYVTSTGTNQVLRYDGSSGTFLNAVGGLISPQGITFGDDGSLYIANPGANDVLRYRNGDLSVFVTAGSGGLSQPRKAVFGPDGNGDGIQDLYVASQANGKVLRYDGVTGAFLDTFATTNLVPAAILGPMWLGFATDGFLYTSVRTSNGFTSIVRFNAATGALVDTLPLERDGWSFNIGPDNVVYSSSNGAGNFVERLGPTSLTAFKVSLDSGSPTPVTVTYTTADGTSRAGSDFTPVSGTLTFAPGETTRTILVQTLDDASSEPTETFSINLSNPAGATIADGQAVGTIADNEPLQVAATVVNGGAVQRSRVTDLTVTFTGLAALPANPASAFFLTRIGPGLPFDDVTLSVDLSGSTATQTVARLSFSGDLTQFGSLVDGRYTLTVQGSQVTGNGQALDGDADGAAGGNYTTSLYRLFGDANGDSVVNGADLTPFIQQFGGPNPTFDSNGDGVVNGADLTQFIANFGKSV